MDLKDDESIQPQHQVVSRVLANLKREPGVRAVSLTGSLAKGTGDAYSDIDLIVGVDPYYTADIWANRHQISAISQHAILDLDHQWGDPSTVSYAVLYETGVYLDLTLVDVRRMETSDALLLWKTASENAADVDRAWHADLDIHSDPLDDALRLFWIGSPLCAKYLLRQQLWTALWFIESRRTLFVKAWRLAHNPTRADWGWSKVHEDLPDTVLRDLAHTVTPLESPLLAQSLAALMAMMARYGPELADIYGVEYPEAAASAVAQMVSRMLA